MKTRIIFIMVLLFLGLGSWNSKNAVAQATENETVKVCVTPAMGDLAKSWINGYNQANPDQKLELKLIDLSDLKTEVNGENTLGLVMQQPDIEMTSNSMWHLTLGRDVVVAVINGANPHIEMLKTKGISSEDLAGIINNKVNTWKDVLENGSNKPVRIFVQDDPELGLAVSKFLNIEPANIIAHTKTNNDFLACIQNDAYSLGFCRLATITDAANHDYMANVQPLSFDLNQNAHIDYVEDIHGNFDRLVRAVWIGKYPRKLVHNIYAISREAPTNETVLSFLNWVVTSGQTAVVQNGFTDLAYYEKQSHLEKLNPPVLLAAETSAEDSNPAAVLLIAVLILAVALVSILVWNSKRKSKQRLYDNAEINKVLRPEAINIPNGLYFDKSHTWTYMEEDGRVRFGIDDFIQKVTGEYTRVIFKNPGEKVKRMEPALTLVCKGKQLTIHSPVSGTIKEINETLVDDPNTINAAPYGAGWVYKIEPSNWIREIGFFKLGKAYTQWINKELIRLKDFLANFAGPLDLENVKPAYQEGGEILMHPLKDLDPKVWEDFQNSFIETADMH